MSAAGFLLVVIAFAILWFVMVRPQRRRRTEQQLMLRNLRVGDDVLTAGGIYGEITALKEDEVRIEIAPRLEVRVARRAIAGVVAPDEEAEPEEPEDPDEPEEAGAGPGPESPADGDDG